MASHLGMTVQQAQVSITSREFLKWVWYLNWKDTEEFSRQDYYLAQIAAQVERGQVKNPSSVTVQRKLLKFTTSSQVVDRESQIRRSKSFWLSVTGIRNKGNKHVRREPR